MSVFIALVNEEGEEEGGEEGGYGEEKREGHWVFHPLRRAVLLDPTSDTCSLPLGHRARQGNWGRAQAPPGWIGLSHVFHLVKVRPTPRPTPGAPGGAGLIESASVGCPVPAQQGALGSACRLGDSHRADPSVSRWMVHLP